MGVGSVDGLQHLAELMVSCGIEGDIYDLPFGTRNSSVASPFSITNGFALTSDQLNLMKIPELEEDESFFAHVKNLHSNYRNSFQNSRTVSYTLKRTLTPWILEKCYQLFKKSSNHIRKEKYIEFCRLSAYWLDDYVQYEVFKEQTSSSDQENEIATNVASVKAIASNALDRTDYYRYVQFVCFEQRKETHQALNALHIGLIVNLPFGVVIDSADVLFHPEVFEQGVQVGCSPEPEHGYPEQAWGVAVYKERSEGLKDYLQEKMKWLSQLGDGVFLDHLVGWSGQYVVPLQIPLESTYPHGRFLTQDHEERTKNIAWFLDRVIESNLTIKGEVAGDAGRVKATREVIDLYIKNGKNIGAMAIPRWESKQNRLKPLSTYEKSTLMMVETHDTSTLVQYLLNQKGYQADFESPTRIQEFCNRILALPFLSNDVPLNLENCTDAFWFEIASRICLGSPCNDIVFTLPGLISLLSKKYRSASIENNINVKPGTPGTVGNGWRNWSHFSPPIEVLSEDKTLIPILKKIGKRSYQPIDSFHELDHKMEIRYSLPQGRQIIYKNKKNIWDVLALSNATFQDILLELIIGNHTEEEAWEQIDLNPAIELDESKTYYFQDLNGYRDCYERSGDQLKQTFLFVRLKPEQIHHFLIFADKKPLEINFNDTLDRDLG